MVGHAASCRRVACGGNDFTEGFISQGIGGKNRQFTGCRVVGLTVQPVRIIEMCIFQA